MFKENILDKYNFTDGDTIVIGLSGGPDSMALFDVLQKYKKKVNINIVVAHVNHNVRQVSNEEAKFVEDYVNKYDVVFESMKIEKYGDDNFENEARNIRYHFFEELINKYNAKYLLTAHHGDDLIETILMRIVRGSTVNGYSGFKEIVKRDNYTIIRPLIYFNKEEILEYDKLNNIPYCIDKTNYMDIHTRNRYRSKILPSLYKESKDVNTKFLKFSKVLESYSDYIDKVTIGIIDKVYKDNTLYIDEYNNLDDLIKNRVLYYVLESIYSDDMFVIHDRHIDLINNLINSTKKNTKVYLPNNVVVVKEYNKLLIENGNNNITSYEIELTDYVELPNNHHLEIISDTPKNGNDICRLDSKEIALPLYVRTRKLGDKIDLFNTNGHTKVKDIFIDKKIPLKDRELWPIVVDSNDKVVWIPNLKKSKFNKKKNEFSDIIIRYI